MLHVDEEVDDCWEEVPDGDVMIMVILFCILSVEKLTLFVVPIEIGLSIFVLIMLVCGVLQRIY